MIMSYLDTNLKNLFRSLDKDPRIINQTAIHIKAADIIMTTQQQQQQQQRQKEVWVCFHGKGGSANRFAEIKNRICPDPHVELYMYEYPGHGFRYRTSSLGDMETWIVDISTFYYYLRHIYPPTTKIVFWGFSWGGYIASQVAARLAITPTPVDQVLLISPFSHYSDVGTLGKLLSTRTNHLLHNLRIPHHQQLQHWHVLLLRSDNTINQYSKDKWKPLHSITVIHDKPYYDNTTHNTVIGSPEYLQWLSTIRLSPQ